MNKKGLTIIELLAALIILGLVASLVGLLISSFQNANTSINDEGKANIEATLLIANVRNDLNEFNPTNYRECTSDSCIILEKHFAYTYSEVDASIILDVYDPPLEYRLEFLNSNLLLNGDIYDLEYFTLGDDFSITFSVNANNDVTIHIDFSLVSESKSYEFSMSYVFEIQAVPE